MVLTPRDFEVFWALVRYYVLTRMQLQRLCFPDDVTGRNARRRLQMLVAEDYVGRARMQVVDATGQSAPAYYPHAKGVQFLAEYRDDPSILLTPTSSPHPMFLAHWLAVSDFHIALDAALARQDEVSCPAWLSEWDVANKDESEPERRYRLYTLVREKPGRIVCAPDAAFVLKKGDNAKAYYVEVDRATSGVQQIAAHKTRGYAAMLERDLRSRHFPQANVPGFGVLSVSPTAGRRRKLAEAVAGQPGASLWRFAAMDELTPDTSLFEPVWYDCKGEAMPLIKRGAKA